jgi:hypothetical protein
VREKAHRTTYPGLVIENKARKPDGGGSQEGRDCREQSPLQVRNLEKILGDGLSLDIVFRVISLADPSQGMDGIGVAQVPLERLEHVSSTW